MMVDTEQLENGKGLSALLDVSPAAFQQYKALAGFPPPVVTVGGVPIWVRDEVLTWAQENQYGRFNPKRPRQWAPERITLLHELRRAGAKHHEIAAQMGLSKQSIAQALLRYPLTETKEN